MDSLPDPTNLLPFSTTMYKAEVSPEIPRLPQGRLQDLRLGMLQAKSPTNKEPRRISKIK
jgi:hypothetical protein